MFTEHTLKLLTIPLFTGVIGYVTNWTRRADAVLPGPVQGAPDPAARSRSSGSCPRKIQQIPGVMHGGIGWQGIIPSRAAKMGSIAVDKGIAKLGSPSEFYEQLDPDKIAEQILSRLAAGHARSVDRIMEREHPRPVARPARRGSRGAARPRPAAAARDRPRGHRRDRRRTSTSCSTSS